MVFRSILLWFAMPVIIGSASLMAASRDTRDAYWKPTGRFEWIDRETGVRVIQITRDGTNNKAVYFHDPCFLGNCLYYRDLSSTPPRVRRVNLETFQSEDALPAGTIEFTISTEQGEIIYLLGDRIRSLNPVTGKDIYLCDLPAELHGSHAGFRVSADGKTLYLHRQDDTSFKTGHDMHNMARASRESLVDRIYEAHLPNKVWALDLKSGKATLIIDANTWLDHFQPSPVDANLLLFAHEGLWNKLQRMWLVHRDGKDMKPLFPKNLALELSGQYSGHEFWNPDGSKVWFDYRKVYAPPRAALASVSLDGAFQSYSCDAKYWSVHYNVSPDGRSFAGDGGAFHFEIAKPGNEPRQEHLFLYAPGRSGELIPRRLCNISFNNYTACEPNIRFTPDGKNLIFMATASPDSDKKQIYMILPGNVPTSGKQH